MKKLIIVILSLLGATLAGCKYENTSSPQLGLFHISHQEITGSSITVVRYDYDDRGHLAEETQTVNGETVYTDSDYEFDQTAGVITYRRTTHAPTLAQFSHVSTYNNGNFQTLLSYEVFPITTTGVGTQAVEYYRMTPDPMLPELRKSREESFKDGVLTVTDNFRYDGTILTYDMTATTGDQPAVKTSVREAYRDSERKYPSAFEVRSEDDKLIEYQLFLYNGTGLIGYEIYRGENMTLSTSGTVDGGVLVEEEGQITISSFGDRQTQTKTVTRYDAQGQNPVETEIEDVFMMRSFGI